MKSERTQDRDSDRLQQIRNLLSGSIAPKALEIVVTAHFRCEDMHQGITVVYHDPLAVAVAIVIIRLYTAMLKQIVAYAVSNR